MSASAAAGRVQLVVSVAKAQRDVRTTAAKCLTGVCVSVCVCVCVCPRARAHACVSV